MTWQTPPSAPRGFGVPPTMQLPVGGPPPGFSPSPPAGPPPGAHPDRGVLILVLALSSLGVMFIACFACGPFALGALALSIPAIVMARADLAAIDRGEMARAGRDTTQVALIIAIVSAAMSVAVGLIMVAVLIFYGGLIGFAALAGA